MNDRERAQLNLILAHAVDTQKRALEERLAAVFADLSANGSMRTGATIKVSIRAMEAAIGELLSDIVQKAQALSATPESFQLISKAVEDFFDYYSSLEITPVAEIIGVRLQDPSQRDVLAVAQSMFDQVRSDIKARLAIIAFDFELIAEPLPSLTAQRATTSIPFKRGGRPRAEFWDDMWAAVAVALYTGDLAPKTQADVERAMADWIEANGYSAVESTVRARARRLWDRISAADG